MSVSADLPVQYLDVFIVRTLGGDMLVGIFKVLKQIVSIFSKISVPLNQVILPIFSKITAKNEKEKGYALVIKIHRIMLPILLAISLIIGLSSQIWMGSIFGIDYNRYWLELTAYLITNAIALSYIGIHPYFLALGKARETFRYTLISNILYLLFITVTINKLNLYSIIVGFTIQYTILIAFITRNIKMELSR